jgi:hypothetical protein
MYSIPPLEGSDELIALFESEDDLLQASVQSHNNLNKK